MCRTDNKQTYQRGKEGEQFSLHETWRNLHYKINKIINGGVFPSQDMTDVPARKEIKRGVLSTHGKSRACFEPFIST